MNLYQKYRPKNFDEMIGNEAEIESFKKALDKKDRPHTYLLTGPSGCGKTTLARIATKQLGGNELTTTEINSADNRGIDTAREIIQQIQYTTIGTRVFIIDEVHMATKEWQNGMLKPLEDTPEHVYFFLCTTTPKKLISTLRNRCTVIKVTIQSKDMLYRWMRRITRDEGLDVSKDTIQEISENCNGSPRMALVLLDKIIGIDESQVKEIISMGEEAEKKVIDLCRALSKGSDWKSVSEILKGLKDIEVENVRYAVLGYMNAVLLSSKNHKVGMIIEIFLEPFYNSGRAGLTLACYQSVIDE